jgi:hypothetical protein
MHFFTNLRIVDESGTRAPDYFENFYTIYRVYFSQNYSIKTFAVQVYISQLYLLL